MVVFAQSKEAFEGFISDLSLISEVIAPTRTDVTRFKRIDSASQIDLSVQPYTPVKEFFFPQRSIVFEFNGDELSVPAYDTSEKVFFGLRRCDLNAIRHQDLVFEGINDPSYTQLRTNTTLIGYHCETPPSEYCFCGSLELAEFFDLMYFDRGDHWLIEVGSEKGAALIERYRERFDESAVVITDEDRVIPGSDRLNSTDIADKYDDPAWQQGVDLCLSCGACTSLCPTCYCFEFKDEVSTADPTKGERVREWSSCQVSGFTLVAGDHVFRDDRASRFKHRIYHQLVYFAERYGVNMCVGCGRCISGCPTRIDFVQMINGMSDA
jgi:sulfhydrogenase subunit beta (sulfur reductase)